MIDPDLIPFLNIFPFRTYFLFSLWGGGFPKNGTGGIFEVYGENLIKIKYYFSEIRESHGVCCTSAFFYVVPDDQCDPQVFANFCAVYKQDIKH